MNDSTADIYIITNLINGKQYVGQTTKGYLYRWKSHCKFAKNTQRKCPQLIDRVIAKYGIDNFKIELLERVPIDQKDQKEQFYINKYNTYSNGYNLTIGGDFNPMDDVNVRKLHRLKMQSKEIRERKSISVKKAYTSELRNWFSNHSKEIWNNWNDESKHNCVRGFIVYNNMKKQPVAIVDDEDNIIKKFESCADACTYCCKDRKRAGEILRYSDRYNKNGKRSTFFGYHWIRL